MKKRKTKGNNNFEPKDNPIGLTEAFPPVKSAQSVDYDKGDDPLGLTQAFAPVQDDGASKPWDKEGKWADFDWEASNKEFHKESSANDFHNEEVKNEEVEDKEDAQGSSEVGNVEPGSDQTQVAQVDADQASQTSELNAQDRSDASTEEEIQQDQDISNQDNAPCDYPKDSSRNDVPSNNLPAVQAAGMPSSEKKNRSAEPKKKAGPKHGRHAAPEKELSPRMKKSRRTRRVLLVLIVLLFTAVGAVGVFTYFTWIGSHQEAAQQVKEQVGAPNHRDDVGNNYNDDTKDKVTKLVDLPELSRVIGINEGEAMNFIKRGAVVTANNPVNEEGNPIKTNLTVALTEEVSGGKTGSTPTVYLGLNEEGRIIQVGCSVSVPSLGYSALSFNDAVTVDRVIEKTLARVGVVVPEGTAVLPANKNEYSTYASDGTTVIRERCSFEGDVDVNGTPCSWSTVLSYDYTTQVVTGNLNDTVRIIYVYITAK